MPAVRARQPDGTELDESSHVSGTGTTKEQSRYVYRRYNLCWATRSAILAGQRNCNPTATKTALANLRCCCGSSGEAQAETIFLWNFGVSWLVLITREQPTACLLDCTICDHIVFRIGGSRGLGCSATASVLALAAYCLLRLSSNQIC